MFELVVELLCIITTVKLLITRVEYGSIDGDPSRIESDDCI